MYHRLVTMRMGVRGWIRNRRIVRRVMVLMMLVVHVGVIVILRFVCVRVFVPLRDVQPDSDSHQRR